MALLVEVTWVGVATDVTGRLPILYLELTGFAPINRDVDEKRAAFPTPPPTKGEHDEHKLGTP